MPPWALFVCCIPMIVGTVIATSGIGRTPVVYVPPLDNPLLRSPFIDDPIHRIPSLSPPSLSPPVQPAPVLEAGFCKGTGIVEKISASKEGMLIAYCVFADEKGGTVFEAIATSGLKEGDVCRLYFFGRTDYAPLTAIDFLAVRAADSH
jgi:hypothetical protein